MSEIQTIQSKIYEIRGQRVMLDRDLAAMYGVETKALNQAVKRNSKRFEGDDFMFRLTKDEAELARSRSQIVTLESPANKGLLENSTSHNPVCTEVVQQPQSNEFIRRFELPSASSVKSALTVLTEKDLVYQTSEGYIVYDRFLGLWLKRL